MARRAIDAAVGAVPGTVVERVTAVGAPLSRYSGRTRAGAAALASAIAALTRPPRLRRQRQQRVSVDAIAAAVGRTEDEVQSWADDGLLGASEEDGVWPAALDRAALLDFALRRGADEAEVEAAARAGRLGLLVLERSVAGDATLTGREVAERAGVPVELATAVWRAFGFPAEDIDQRRFSRAEVHAMRVIGAMRSVFTEEDLTEASSVVGRAMAEVSAAAVELFRRRVTEPFLEAGLGELEVALRLAAMSELLIPPLEPVLEVAFRRHLQAAVQSEAALRLEETAETEVQELSVGFADLVGFTTLSEHMSPLELGELASRLLRITEPALTAHGARFVKTIGDA
ncbi:MAG: adenylate cyclase regulatory domain-containing protein, partial [Candidatus Dormibacteria bacterium]